MVRSILIVAAMILSGGLAGCGNAQQPAGPPDDGYARLEQQARGHLARWDEAVSAGGPGLAYVPVGEQFKQIGDWEEAVGGNHKAALVAGKLVPIVAFPAPVTSNTEIRWKDGKSRPAQVVPADEALRALSAAATPQDCGCTPIEVTGAKLNTGTVRTSRGEATLPVWEFTLKDSAVLVTYPAITPSSGLTVTPPSWDPNNAPGGLTIESAKASTSEGKRLTVNFTGSPGPASQPCGADYTAFPVESANAVVIIVLEQRNPTEQMCTAIGAQRTAEVTLNAALGERTVLEIMQGMPVPLTFE
jgi:hypothetical protein